MEFCVWESQTSLLCCLPWGKMFPYLQSSPETLFFFQTEQFQLSHPFCMTDAPIFSWSMMNSVCLSCANKARTGYSGLTTPQWRGRTTSLHLVGNTLADVIKVLLAFFAERAHCCLLFSLVFWYISHSNSFFIPSESLLLHLACFIFMLKSSESCSSMQAHVWLFSCQDRPRLGGASPRSSFSPGLSAMGFSQADPGGKLCAHLKSCFLHWNLFPSYRILNSTILWSLQQGWSKSSHPWPSSSFLVSVGSSRPSSLVDSWIFRKGHWLAVAYCTDFL